jgi:hypothetical protein
MAERLKKIDAAFKLKIAGWTMLLFEDAVNHGPS